MITWVTVWVLTVVIGEGHHGTASYQLQYATQKTCLEQAKNHKRTGASTRCDFQQIPVVKK